MDGRLEGADSRRDERLERASESRREPLRLVGGGAMMSSGLCTGEEIDLGVVRERWRRMRKGRERAKKWEEMAGWDEDELVGSEDDKRPRIKITAATSSGSLDLDRELALIGTSYLREKKCVYITGYTELDRWAVPVK